MSITKEGIFIFKNSKGFGFRVKQNKFVLATAQGYNTKHGAKKGLVALYNLLHAERTAPNGPTRPVIIDLTNKKQAAVASIEYGIEYRYTTPSAKAVKKLAKKSPPHIKAWLGVPKKTKKTKKK